MRRRSLEAAMRLCLLLMLLVGGIAQDDCLLNFIEQPITFVECNIYQEDRITLTCTISSVGVSDPSRFLETDNLNIKWFFDNGTDHELTTGTDETRREGGNGDPVMISSTLALSGSLQRNVTRLAEGSYYCRVQVDDQTMQANTSQRFTAGNFDEHLQGGESCSGKNFIARENKCAVHNIIAEDSTATTSETTSSVQEVTNTEPPTVGENQSTGPASPSPDGNGGGSTLQVWIYVLVAVAAVFAMIIIILAIMCVGLCLRRSQTMDANYNNKENGGIQGNFHQLSHSSMVNNEMYRGGGVGAEETDFTGERDYEVISVKPSCDPSSCDNTQDYHRLQRPSPPAVPTGRNAMFGFSPPNGEFRSMSTLTSQMNGINMTCDFHHQKFIPPTKPGYSTLPLLSSRDPPPPYNRNGEPHVYRELENPATTLPVGQFSNRGGAIYRSPTSSSPPDSAKYFEHSDSTTELLPPLPARGITTNGGHRKTSDASLNESLYNPCQPHPLEKIPETGTMFPEPQNPTAFPVSDYDYIPTMTEYEKPVASKPKKVGENPKTRVSTKSMNYETDPNLELRGNDDMADCTADSTDMTGESITEFKLPLADDTTADSSDFTGASDMHFPIGLKQNGTAISNELSAADFTGGSSTGGYRSSVLSADYTGASEDNIPSSMLNDLTESKKNLRMNGMCYPDNRRSQSHERRSTSRERRSFSREAPSLSQTSGLEDNINEHNLPAVVPPPHIIAGNKVHNITPPPPSSITLPQSRPHPYKELDTSSLKAHMDYAKLRVGPGTVV